MTYEDPRTGRERNLGQDNVANSTGSWIAGIIVVAAIALGGWYFYNHNQRVADVNHPATNAATTESGTPGSTSAPANSSSSTGTSSGTSGTNPNTDNTAPAPNAPKP
jgi:hypothetical protein